MQILTSGNSVLFFPLNHNTSYSIGHTQIPPLSPHEIQQIFLSNNQGLFDFSA